MIISQEAKFEGLLNSWVMHAPVHGNKEGCRVTMRIPISITGSFESHLLLISMVVKGFQTETKRNFFFFINIRTITARQVLTLTTARTAAPRAFRRPISLVLKGNRHAMMIKPSTILTLQLRYQAINQYFQSFELTTLRGLPKSN